MTTSKWREISRETIYYKLLEYEAQQTLLEQTFSQKEVFKLISEAYPFGERRRHPYKQWLKEVALAKQFMKLKRPMREFEWFAERNDRALKAPPLPRVGPGQMSLLEVSS